LAKELGPRFCHANNTAATTGTRADIKAASDQLEVVLRARQLLSD
jgi:hypothetical protein